MFFLFLLGFTAILGDLFLFFPTLILVFPFSIRLYRRYADFLAKYWFKLCVFMLEDYFGIKMIFAGDLPLPSKGEVAVMISNHRTRLDWMFLWSFIAEWGSLEHEKIILKRSLKSSPGFGWAMQKFCFLFLDRKWEQDIKQIESILNYFIVEKYPLQLLLFPEGTDLSEENRQKNKEYTTQHGLKTYDHLLYPRTRGWQHTMSVLGDSVDAVYDITIGYPDLVPQTEKALMNATLPKEIHFHVKRYDVKNLPKGEKELADWLIERWNDKETLLDHFYITKKFPNIKQPSKRNIFRGLIIVPWLLFLGITLYNLFCSSLVLCYAIFVICCEIVITALGGADNFEVNWYSKIKQKKS